MSIDKFLNPDFTPDESTKAEVENLHKEGQSLAGINLKFAEMSQAKLVNGDLSNSDLTRADFSGASLYGINLEGSNLFKTNFEGANLKSGNLKNCDLLGADFTNTKLNNVDWGKDFKVINEIEAEKAVASGDHEKAIKKYLEAEDIYRVLKISMQAQTLGEDVGKMFLREMIVKRKQMPKYSPLRMISKIAHLTTGYGEKLGNIFYTVNAVIIICALLFGVAGVQYGEKVLGFQYINNFGLLDTLGNLFYFSVVVFSTVGFGEIVPINLLGKFIMIFEGMTGGIILSIFIIAVYKQLMDR